MQKCGECKKPKKTLIPIVVWRKKKARMLMVCPICFGKICESHYKDDEKERVKAYVH